MLNKEVNSVLACSLCFNCVVNGSYMLGKQSTTQITFCRRVLTPPERQTTYLTNIFWKSLCAQLWFQTSNCKISASVREILCCDRLTWGQEEEDDDVTVCWCVAMLGPLRSREEEEVEGMKGRVAEMLFAADMLRKLLDWGTTELRLRWPLEEAAETQHANYIVKSSKW